MDGRLSRCRIRLQKITITESQKQTLIDHSDKEKPNESCAILFGKNIEGNSTVTELFLTENTEQSPVNFTISNEQLIQIYKKAEEKNLEVVGIFHSHPTSEAIPSKTDTKFMQSNPVVWIIYSGINKNFKAYVLDSDLKEIQIVIK